MELADFPARNKVHVTLIQETKLRENSKTPIFIGYSTIHLDHPADDAGGAGWRLSASRSPTSTPCG